MNTYAEAMVAKRKALKLNQPAFAQWLNERLGRRYDRVRISKMENGNEPVPAIVRLLLQPPPDDAARTKTVAIVNQKGGVGKTTAAVHISYALAAAGHATLLVDMDAQANATMHLGIVSSVLEKAGKTVYDVLLKGAKISDVILPVSERHPLHVVPSSDYMAAAEMEMTNQLAREYLLHNALKPIKPQFRFILIDCPPVLGHATINALAAADQVIIPTETATFSIAGIRVLMNTIENVQSRINPHLEIFGVIPQLVDGGTNQDRESMKDLVALYGHLRIFPRVPRTILYKAAVAAGKSLFEYDANAKGLDVYADVASSLIESASLENLCHGS